MKTTYNLLVVILLVATVICVVKANDVSIASRSIQVTYLTANSSSDFRVDFCVGGVPTGIHLIWSYQRLVEIEKPTPAPSIQPGGISPDSIGSTTTTTTTKEGTIGAADTNKAKLPLFEKVRQQANITTDTVTSSGGAAVRRREYNDNLRERISTLPVSTGVDQSGNTNMTFESEGFVLLQNYTFEGDASASSSSVFVKKGGFKFNFGIRDWPFSLNAVALEQPVKVTVNPPEALNYTNGDLKFSILHPEGIQEWVFQLATQCQISDGSFVDISIASNLLAPGVIDLSFLFPVSNYIFYDPDLQALVSDDDPGSGDGGDGGSGGHGGSSSTGGAGDGNSNDVTIAIAVLVPVAVVLVVVALMVAAGLAGWRIVARWHQRRALDNLAASSAACDI